ncbi:TraB/GumN family protein [Pelomonas sp. SE-A7]|uniref:TraB/GumN family protein n=1 Tax=Pelomonas sp. SE-A7 TaxID=3054953 RepID=UPI00259D088C|nr:TraB/GumN family protein [Pelomonas sp. SE-A7]MDM4766684.1 TraB/GumN family protein [Pelomonas sp. SE-A7]
MNEVQELTPAALSRRRALVGMGVAAGSMLSSSLRAQPAPAWPLWQVHGQDGRRAYLFGETPARASPWHDARIEALLPTCSVLWNETNQQWRGDRQGVIKRYGMDLQTPLPRKLDAARLARLEQVAALAKMPLESLAPLRPWTAALTLEGAYYAQLKRNPAHSAENILIPIARQAGIAQASEFAAQDDVCAFMGEFTPEQDLQFLDYTLDNLLAGPEANERIHASWARGDAAPAEQVVLRTKTQYPAIHERMVLDRNRGWVSRFAQMLAADKPAMVVVGLYHMAGPDSVVAQLRAAGYRLSRI